MTMIDPKSLSDKGLVAQYVIELLGHGHFLSHEDYARVDKWLVLSGSADELLLLLDEVLPARIERSRQAGKKVFSLSSVSNSIEKRLLERNKLTGGIVSVE